MKQTLGERIKQARHAKGMTQEQLASLIGVEPPAITNYEKNARRPSSERIGKIATILNVASDWLLGETESIIRPGEDIDIPPELQVYFRKSRWYSLEPNDRRRLLQLIKGFMVEEEEDQGNPNNNS